MNFIRFTIETLFFQNIQNEENISNFREGLFEILPKGSFEMNDEYLKYKSKELEIRALSEKEQYEQLIETKKNEEVLFGQEVVFRHHDSQQYLSGSSDCNEQSADAFQVRLNKQITSQAIFRILPFNSYQKEGQPIGFNEGILIQHEKHSFYLDFVNDIKSFLDQSFDEEDSDLIKNELVEGKQLVNNIKKNDQDSKRYDVVITNNTDIRWKLQLYEKQEKALETRELVTLRYTKNNYYLTYDPSVNKIYLDDLENDQISLNCIWELQLTKRSQILGSPTQKRSILQMDCFTPKRSFNLSNEYIIRHYITGKVLTSQHIDKNVSLQQFTNNELQKFDLDLVKSDQFTDNSIVFIKQYGKNLIRSKKSGNKSRMVLSDKDVNHAFQLNKINEESKENMLFILSSQEIIFKFIRIFQSDWKSIIDILTNSLLSQCANVLWKLICYVLDQPEDDCNLDQTPVFARQNAMKDLLIIELVLQNIVCQQDFLYINQKQYKTEAQQFKEIFNNSYRLLKVLIKNNKEIKQQVSKHLDFFLQQAVRIDIPIVQDFLYELLDNNHRAISKYINKKSIETVVSILFDCQPHEKYLKILSAICVCKDRAVINNQNYVLEYFFKSAKTEFMFKFKGVHKTKVVLFCYLNGEMPAWRQLKQFYEDSLQMEGLKSWDYYLSYMNLLADVCLGQNRLALEFVNDHVPLSTLCSLLEEHESSVEAHLKLLHHAYVEHTLYLPIRKIGKVKVWNQISQNKDIPRTWVGSEYLPENTDLKLVLDYVSQYIAKQDLQQNKTLLRVLKIIKTTLDLGFWQSIKDLGPLLKDCLKICSFSEGYECKMLACQIIEIIFELETSIRLNKMLYEFKKSQEKQSEEVDVNNKLNNNHSGCWKKQKKQEIILDKRISQTNKWIYVINKILKENDLIKELPDNLKSELIFIKFQNPKMLQYGLKLLNMVYGQRKKLYDTFEQIVILHEEDKISQELVDEVRRMRSKIEILKSENIFLISLKNQQEYSVMIWPNLIQSINMWAKSLLLSYRNKKVVQQLEYEDLYLKDGVRMLYNEFDENDHTHQQMFKAQDIHSVLIKYIDISSKINKDNDLQIKLLDIIYEYLTLLVLNNAYNKSLVNIKLKQVMNHLHLNIACCDFLREIFTNNKDLLYNDQIIKSLVQKVVSNVNDQDVEKYYKGKLLDVLRVIQYDNNKTIKKNQQLTMNILFNKKYTKLMYIFNKLEQENNLWNDQEYEKYYQVYMNQYNYLSDYINIPAPIMYMSVYFQVFSLLIEDKNKINVDKCKTIHTYQELINILQYTHKCWPLQFALRAYINRLYYRFHTQNNYLFIEQEISNIIINLDSIIHFKTQLYKKQTQINNPIRYQYLFTYVYTTFQEILFTLNLILLDDDFLVQLEDHLNSKISEANYETHCDLFHLTSQLIELSNLWFKSKYITEFLNDIINLFKCIFQTFPPLVLQNIANILAQLNIISENPEEIINSILSNISSRQVVIPNAQQTSQIQITILENALRKMIRSRFRKKMISKQTQAELNKELNIKHRMLVGHLAKSEGFIQYQEQEFIILCNNLQQVDVEYQNLSKQQTFLLKDFIKNVINMNIKYPDALTDELRIFFLKVLVRLISKNNSNEECINIPIDEWEPEQWSDSKDDIQKYQNMLDDCGAASLIYQMFNQKNLQDKQALCTQVIIFTNAFLLGGNTQCQNSLLSKFKQDETNEMLNNLKDLISKFSRFVQNNFKIKIQEEQTVQKQDHIHECQYLDNRSSFSEQSETLARVLPSAYESQESSQKKQLSIQILKRAFRMLQLLCENNNVEMKDYLREQTDSSCTVHINSIDYVQFSTKQLSAFFKVLNLNIIPICSQIVDFINEVIQLPVLLNQKTLCKTTYIEDACFTSKFFTLSENLKERNLDKSSDLQELKSKVIQSLLLVLEGNDKQNYEDLQTKLDPEFLIQFAKDIALTQGLKTDEPIFPTHLQQIIDVYIIIKKVESKTPGEWVKQVTQMFEKDEDPLVKSIYKFFQANLKQIEILYEGDLQMVFFPYHPVFKFLSGETRDKIMDTISRETQREKLIGLQKLFETIKSEIEYNFYLNSQTLPITHKTIARLTNLAQTISLIVNIFLVQAVFVVIKDQQSNYEIEDYEQWILQILGTIQLVISLFAFIFFIISRAPLEVKDLNPLMADLKLGPMAFVKSLLDRVILIFKGDDFLQHFIFVGISYIGLNINIYYFSLHLFYLFARLELLRSVFQAISYNASQLLLVSALGVLFQFVFSFVAFYNYVDDIYPDEVPEDACHSLVSCTITLMTSGVVGGDMAEWDPLKFMYDTLYSVFFGMLFTNIISGIMIGTFAELRDKKKKIVDDKKNQCFICGIDRGTLEKNQEDFDEHVGQKHHLWNYAFYLYCLDKKDSTEYTGLEYWIMDKIEKENICWYPIVTSDQGDLDQGIENISTKLNRIKELIQQKHEELVNYIQE